jgi:hypothetical protein
MFDNLNKHTLLNKNLNTFIRKSIIIKTKTFYSVPFYFWHGIRDYINSKRHFTIVYPKFLRV